MNTWQLGETLEVVDQPALPETPIAPNRAVIIAASALLGLLLGAAIAAWRDWTNDAIVSIRQLRTLAPASVLGGIPLLEDELAVRRRRRAAVLSWASASLFSLVSIAGAVIYHQYSIFQLKDEPEGRRDNRDQGRAPFYDSVSVVRRPDKRLVVEAVGMWKSPGDFQGRWEERKTGVWFSALSTARHFHGPSFPRPYPPSAWPDQARRASG